VRRASYVWRFFVVVPPVPRLLHAAIAVTTVVVGAVIVLDSRRAAVSLTSLLLLQLFAASSGFLPAARRGYYDLVLTVGERRGVVAAVHWMLSVLPGLVGWCVLACIEALVTRQADGALFTRGTLAAMFVVSTIPWAAGVALPRFAIGIAWLLASSVLWIPGPATGPAAPVLGTLDGLLYPPLLVGAELAGADALPAIVSVLAAGAALLLALAWIERADIALDVQ
jgi:hypothetical protein